MLTCVLTAGVHGCEKRPFFHDIDFDHLNSLLETPGGWQRIRPALGAGALCPDSETTETCSSPLPPSRWFQQHVAGMSRINTVGGRTLYTAMPGYSQRRGQH